MRQHHYPHFIYLLVGVITLSACHASSPPPNPVTTPNAPQQPAAKVLTERTFEVPVSETHWKKTWTEAKPAPSEALQAKGFRYISSSMLESPYCMPPQLLARREPNISAQGKKHFTASLLVPEAAFFCTRNQESWLSLYQQQHFPPHYLACFLAGSFRLQEEDFTPTACTATLWQLLQEKVPQDLPLAWKAPFDCATAIDHTLFAQRTTLKTTLEQAVTRAVQAYTAGTEANATVMEVQQFFAHTSSGLSPYKGEAQRKAFQCMATWLTQTPAIQPIATTPMCKALLCVRLDQRGNLPPEIAALITSFAMGTALARESPAATQALAACLSLPPPRGLGAEDPLAQQLQTYCLPPPPKKLYSLLAKCADLIRFQNKKALK